MMGKEKHTKKLSVIVAGSQVGTLAEDERGQIWFEYDAMWIKNGFALSPMPSFALKQGAFKATRPTFDGLHGVFNDALPDGWGLLLMDRALKKALNWDAHQITTLDRLAYIGNKAMGALEFKPLLTPSQAAEAPSIARLAEESLQVQEGDAAEVLSALYLYGGSPGGARPKVTVALAIDGTERVLSGFEDIPEDFEHWMVKFRSAATDPECMGRIEQAYAQMAKTAKVQMPPTRLLSATVRGVNELFFAVQRFDRLKKQKLHVISLGGMLEASHREPCLDYTDLLKAVHFATKNFQDVERAFRLMVFNVLAHNKDDHVKNFAFVFTGQHWQLAPAFDLTFSGGVNNQHTTAIAGQGNPELSALQQVAKGAGIKHAKQIMDEVYTAVSQWRRFASEQGVTPDVMDAYAAAIEAGPCYGALTSSMP
jgi:serine/threonine-protein kinase HipA